jgi:hypothetical protein
LVCNFKGRTQTEGISEEGPRRPKGDEVLGGWRKLHNEELHNVYFSPNIIEIIKSKTMSWTGHVARMEKKRDAYRVLVGKPEGKRQQSRPNTWVER